MNIEQLESFSLTESAKFKNTLNPAVWDKHEHLKNAFKGQIRVGADQYRQHLGLNETQIKDVVVAGINAGYLYENDNTIDVVFIADINPDPTFRELFMEHNYKFNHLHRFEVDGHVIQFHVHPSDEPFVSRGNYSVIRECWNQVAQRKQLEPQDTVSLLRKAGYENSPRPAVVKKKKVIKERKPVVYGYGSDFIAEVSITPDGTSPTTSQFTNEEDIESMSEEDILQDFINFCASSLDLAELPQVKLRRDPQWSVVNKTFGRYSNEGKVLEVAWGKRHIMDVLRTVAHELTHAKQHEREELPDTAGDTGSPFENEANARAGILMRDYAKLHPEFFSHGLSESNKLFCRILKSDNELHEYARALNQSLIVERPSPINSYREMCFMLRQLVKNSLNEGATIPHIVAGQALIDKLKEYDEYNHLKIAVGTNVAIINYELTGDSAELWGFTTPKTITKIYRESTDNSIKQFEFNNDPTDVWPRKEQAEYKGYRLVNSAFFGSKESAEQALTMIALGNSEQLSITNHIKESLLEASGYIPTAAQADDPRFEMALTADIRPGALGLNANKLLLNTDSQGHPQEMRTDGVVKRMMEDYKRFKQ